MSDLKAFNKMIVAPNTQAYLQGVIGERNGEIINKPTTGGNNIKERSVSDIVYLGKAEDSATEST